MSDSRIMAWYADPADGQSVDSIRLAMRQMLGITATQRRIMTMIKDVKTLIEAKRLVMADSALQSSLREWHMHKGTFSSVASDYCFDD